jgi:hypothetical protein
MGSEKIHTERKIRVAAAAGFPVFHPHVSLRGFPSGWSCVERGRRDRREGIRDAETQNAGVVVVAVHPVKNKKTPFFIVVTACVCMLVSFLYLNLLVF